MDLRGALNDEDLIRKVRCAVEEDRVQDEAYGARMSTDEFVRLTIAALADALVEFEPPGLRDLVSRLAYKPGWEFFLTTSYDGDGSGGLTLTIVSDTTNSYDHSKTIRVGHPFLVPRASYNERNWVAWIFDRIRDVEANHEAGEFFMVDGVRMFAPHHANGENPYVVWHVGDYEDTRVKSGRAK